MDSSVAGTVIAEQLAAIENEYGDVEDAEIGTVITIVEVRSSRGSDLRVRHNLGGQPYRLIGFMRVAEEITLSDFRGGQEPAE
jgi:hypothetical protein